MGNIQIRDLTLYYQEKLGLFQLIKKSTLFGPFQGENQIQIQLRFKSKVILLADLPNTLLHNTFNVVNMIFVNLLLQLNN